MRKLAITIAALAAFLTVGCSTWHPHPLPEKKGAAKAEAEARPRPEKEGIAGVAEAVLYAEAKHGRAKLLVVDNVPVLHLYGNADEIGAQYGTILKELLVELEKLKPKFFTDLKQEIMARFMASGIEKFIPGDYVTEMKAIAKAGGVDYMLILIVNGLGEVMCSTIAAWGERTGSGKMLFGRNLGQSVLPGVSDKIALVTVYHPKGKNAFASVGVVGVLGAYSAMNEKGLCIGNTTSVNARKSSTLSGIPPGFLYRQLMEECDTVQEAREKIEKLKFKPLRASTLMITDADNNAVVAEIGPDGAAFREPDGEILYATNHFLTEKMKSGDSQCWRFDKFREVEKKNGKLDVGSIKKILFDVIQKDVTLQTMVFEPADREMHVAFHRHGRAASETKYHTLKATDLFPKADLRSR